MTLKAGIVGVLDLSVAHTVWGDELGIVAQLFVTYEDETELILESDSAWKASTDQIPIQKREYIRWGALRHIKATAQLGIS
jgi:hypothetical protein